MLSKFDHQTFWCLINQRLKMQYKQHQNKRKQYLTVLLNGTRSWRIRFVGFFYNHWRIILLMLIGQYCWLSKIIVFCMGKFIILYHLKEIERSNFKVYYMYFRMSRSESNQSLISRHWYIPMKQVIKRSLEQLINTKNNRNYVRKK